MRDDDFLNFEELDREDLDEFLRNDPELHQLIQDFDAEAPGTGIGWRDLKFDEAGVDDASSGGTLIDETPAALEVSGETSLVKGKKKKRKKVTTTCKRKRLARSCKKRSIPCCDPKHQSRSLTQLKVLAGCLQKSYGPLSSMNEENIVRLLHQGAKLILPQLPAKHSTKHEPFDVPKRTGLKRGVYKQQARDGWTSCKGRGASGTVPHNATENMRNPLSQFKERDLFVNEVELCDESAGEVEVPAFEQCTLTARDYVFEDSETQRKTFDVPHHEETAVNIGGIDTETADDGSFDTNEGMTTLEEKRNLDDEKGSAGWEQSCTLIAAV